MVQKLKELSSTDAAIEGLLSHRPWQLKAIFSDLYDPLVKEKRASLEKQKKREDRFVSLLEEYYFRSDHVDVTWDQAKRALERHSAYDALERGDRRRLFDAHMNTLRSKLAEKKLAMAALQGLSIEGAEEGEVLDIPEVPTAPQVKEVPRRPGKTFERAVGRGRELTLPAWMMSEASKSSNATQVSIDKSEKFADAANDGQAFTSESLNGADPTVMPVGGDASMSLEEKEDPLHPIKPDQGEQESFPTADKRERDADEDEILEKGGSSKPSKRARRTSRRK